MLPSGKHPDFEDLPYYIKLKKERDASMLENL